MLTSYLVLQSTHVNSSFREAQNTAAETFMGVPVRLPGRLPGRSWIRPQGHNAHLGGVAHPSGGAAHTLVASRAPPMERPAPPVTSHTFWRSHAQLGGTTLTSVASLAHSAEWCTPRVVAHTRGRVGAQHLHARRHVWPHSRECA